jgi:hypothetical protein
VWLESRLLGFAWGCAAALALVTLAAWLVPLSVLDSGLLLIGRRTLADLLPLLYGHRVVLLLVVVVAVAVAAACHLLLWSSVRPGGGGLVLCVAAELVILVVTLPLAGIVLGLLLLNAAVWVAVIVIGFHVLIRLLP